MTNVQKDKRINVIVKILTNLGYKVKKNSITDWNATKGKYGSDKYCEIDTDCSFDELPYCCGVQEAGQLCFEIEESGLSDSEYDQVQELVAELFLLSIHPNPTQRTSRNKIKTVRPIILNSNGDDHWIPLEKQLKLMPTLYNHVSTAINPNSGNIIKTYISI